MPTTSTRSSAPDARSLAKVFIGLALVFSLWVPLALLLMDNPRLTLTGVLAFEGVVLIAAGAATGLRALVQLQQGRRGG